MEENNEANWRKYYWYGVKKVNRFFIQEKLYK